VTNRKRENWAKLVEKIGLAKKKSQKKNWALALGSAIKKKIGPWPSAPPSKK
jgi:hypothetical protein